MRRFRAADVAEEARRGLWPAPAPVAPTPAPEDHSEAAGVQWLCADLGHAAFLVATDRDRGFSLTQELATMQQIALQGHWAQGVVQTQDEIIRAVYATPT